MRILSESHQCHAMKPKKQMTKVCIVVRNTLVRDRRTLTEAQTLALFGLNVVVIGLWSKNLPRQEQREDFIVKRIIPASHRLSTTGIHWYKSLIKALPSPFKRYLRRINPFVFAIIRKIARIVNKPLTYLFLASASLREQADYYHAHFPTSLMALIWIVSILLRRPFIRDYNDIIVISHRNKSKPYYEQEILWNKELSLGEIRRIENVINAIPEGVNSILDVGCGDGRITNRLSTLYGHVVGLDRSCAALRHVQTQTVQASADAIPFGDQTFDLVIATELLEHLPKTIYDRAREEIQRVAKKWILISVPWKEYLNIAYARCPCCNIVFHVNYHQRSFSERKLRKLFEPRFKLISLKETGSERRNYVSVLLWIKQRVGGVWTRTPTTVCPCCLVSLCPGKFPEQNAISWFCDKWNATITARKVLEKSHVIALYQRREIDNAG